MKNLEELLFDKYGPRLTIGELGQAMKKDPQTIRNEISQETFPIPTYKDNESHSSPRYADVRDVAKYLEQKRPKAA
jgi:hypothetical protein